MSLMESGYNFDTGDLSMHANYTGDLSMHATYTGDLSMHASSASETDATNNVVRVLNSTCVICLDEAVPVDHMITPCHHLCLCATCAANVKNMRMPCPVCRRAQRKDSCVCF